MGKSKIKKSRKRNKTKKKQGINKTMKNKLIDNLKNNIFCRIKPSKINGIGVFAIKDIPKNTNPFVVSGKECIPQKTVNLNEKEIMNLEPEIKNMIKDFFAESNGIYGLPYYGINSIDISFYINHSDKPNVEWVYVKNCNFAIIKTLKKIKKGEELLLDYGIYKKF